MIQREHITSLRSYYAEIAEEFERIADIVRHRSKPDSEMAEHLGALAGHIRKDSGLDEANTAPQPIWSVRLYSKKKM
jgi:hypothetical protein